MAIKHHALKKAIFDILPFPQLFPTTPIHSYSYKKLTDSSDSTDSTDSSDSTDSTDSSDSTDSMHSDILARQRKNKY